IGCRRALRFALRERHRRFGTVATAKLTSRWSGLSERPARARHTASRGDGGGALPGSPGRYRLKRLGVSVFGWPDPGMERKAVCHRTASVRHVQVSFLVPAKDHRWI